MNTAHDNGVVVGQRRWSRARSPLVVLLMTALSVLGWTALGPPAAAAPAGVPAAYDQTYRPQFHYTPTKNWMNDPNGPIFFRGRYHMFHQYNPQAAVWGNMNWAHATSPDMIRWRNGPIALSPTPAGPDRDGVFSGSAVLDRGKPTVIYTAVAPPAGELTLFPPKSPQAATPHAGAARRRALRQLPVPRRAFPQRRWPD